MRVNRISSTHTEKQSCTRADSFLIICTSEVIPSLVERSVITCERGSLQPAHGRKTCCCGAFWRCREAGGDTHPPHVHEHLKRKDDWLMAVVTVVTMAHPRQVSLWPALSYFNVSCTAPLAKDLLHTERLDRRTYQAWDFRLDMLCLSHLECGVRW